MRALHDAEALRSKTLELEKQTELLHAVTDNAEAYVYRKSAREPFQLAMAGLPAPQGTVASRLATHPAEPNIFYTANNHGLFRSQDAGLSWRALDIPWPAGAFRERVSALALFTQR